MNDTDARIAALKALIPPNMRDMLAHPRSPVGRTATYDEAIQFITNMMGALHRTPRLPIHTNTTREPDGSLTIHITPGT